MKKKFTPDYIVDFSKIEDYNDLVIEMTKKKVDANKKLDKADLIAFATAILLQYEETCPRINIVTIKAIENKKTPWYKRIWNKIKSIFTHKK